MPTLSTVYIIDDDQELIDSLKWLLESMNYKVISCLSGQEFLNLGRLNHPCCILSDVRMPRTSGLELQEILISRNEIAPIIFISGHGDMLTVIRAMKAGAMDFLTKPVNNQLLLECINKAIDYDLKQYHHRLQRENITVRFNTLTIREYDILKLIVLNLSSKAIAKHLQISPNTVDLHRAKIMKKLAVKNIVEVVNLAWCAGIVTPETLSVTNTTTVANV